MCGSEMITDFSLEDKCVGDLIKALNAYCESVCGEWNERKFNDTTVWDLDSKGSSKKLPEKFRWLVAFAVEGENEGWYVHVGSIGAGVYTDFGHCKTFDVNNAYALAREAQRFLTAARWN